MDFDGDGKLDLISGSYDPGEIYLFRGLGQGKFNAVETVKDKTGKPVLRVPDQKDKVESFGSWYTLVDWDDDGKHDLLIGGFDGTMFVRRNLGTRTKPEFSPENIWVMTGKKKLRVPGGAHANPVVVDWDGDGLWDIITGSGDGGIYWYRNTGKKGDPAFASPIALVAKHEGIGYSELLEPGQEPKPGIRSQIAVADFDGDGKQDLLLGDFCTYLHVKKDLPPDQLQKFQSLQKQQKDVAKGLRQAMEDIRARYKELMKNVPKSDWNAPEHSAKWTKLYQEMKESESYKKTMKEYESLGKEIGTFIEQGAGRLGDDPATPHGYVWLYRRK